MNVIVQQPWTVARFLEWEDRQAERYEFDGTGPVAMVGGKINHALIQSNLIVAVATRLARRECRIVGSDLKLAMTRTVRYPDAMVFCSSPDGRLTSITDPVVVFEILSPSTRATDECVKADEYRGLAGLVRYVMIEQDSMRSDTWVRSGAEWRAEQVSSDSAILELPEIGVSVPLAELYRGVTFATVG